jgi:Protein of unknown function (DUF3048) C-terminal domain
MPTPGVVSRLSRPLSHSGSKISTRWSTMAAISPAPKTGPRRTICTPTTPCWPSWSQNLALARLPRLRPCPARQMPPRLRLLTRSSKIHFSTSPYAVQYTFATATDSYARVMGGVPHIDRNTGAQISVKNIVLEYVPPPTARKTTASPRPTITSSGVGRRWCLQMAGRRRPAGARPQTVPPHIFSTPPANPSR